MHRSIGLCVAVTTYVPVLLASPGIANSEEHPKLVDTGVIFSVQQVESERLRSSDVTRFFGLLPPFWMPVPEDIALLEGKLKSYLESATSPAAKAIAANIGNYKRQYVGYTDGGKRWIFVNGFCEEIWKESDKWHDGLELVMDGGLCYFTVRYNVSKSRFKYLLINKTIAGGQ